MDIEKISKVLEGVLVGKITDIQKHPNADKLILLNLDVGSETKRQIVTGAPNVKTGNTVCFITAGNLLPRPYLTEGKEIILQPRDLRGIISDAMLMAPDELCLGDDHLGVLILEESGYLENVKAVKLGEPILKCVNKKFVEDIIKYLSSRTEKF